jgi:hypothetical protein
MPQHKQSVLPPSVLQKITRARRARVAYAALNAAAIGMSAAYVAAGGSQWLLLLTAWQAVVLARNCIGALNAQIALRIYRRDPAAAYIAEVRNAFGPLHDGRIVRHERVVK